MRRLAVYLFTLCSALSLLLGGGGCRGCPTQERVTRLAASISPGMPADDVRAMLEARGFAVRRSTFDLTGTGPDCFGQWIHASVKLDDQDRVVSSQVRFESAWP